MGGPDFVQSQEPGMRRDRIQAAVGSWSNYQRADSPTSAPRWEDRSCDANNLSLRPINYEGESNASIEKSVMDLFIVLIEI